MTESLITISLVGFIAGFVFSIPVAGPISILIVSNALKGKFHYSVKAAIGAAFADFFYVFIAMIGITRLYHIYQPAIPYILMVGGVFLIYVAHQVYKSKLSKDEIEKGPIIREKYLNRGGFRTGFLLNFLNPTLFFGWLTSTFITMSLVTSLGFNMGGLEQSINHTLKMVEENKVGGIGSTMRAETLTSHLPARIPTTEKDSPQPEAQKEASRKYHYAISALYAFWLSLGSILWFYLFARVIVKSRHRINVQLINHLLKGFGVILALFSIYLLGRGIDLLIN
ncbi:MAG: LysE family translocator [Bacteroidales bacterium]